MKKEVIAGIVIAVLLIGGLIYFLLTQPEDKTSGVSETSETSEIQETPGISDEDISSGTELTIENEKIINIEGFAFSPKELRIKVGDSVTWTNKDSVGHTVTSDSGTELDSDLLSKEESFSHAFTKAGTYTYYCSIHPSMKATIIVE
ncbi:MAG TPA: cupredoxin family copper-binding protein [Candidatus Nanoarchaeia archaeon]|nr:cupredoxin family copper-binding protein [Candidatus Nanoarchaeia archaeon]